MVGGAEALRKEGAPTGIHIFCESFLRGETATPSLHQLRITNQCWLNLCRQPDETKHKAMIKI